MNFYLRKLSKDDIFSNSLPSFPRRSLGPVTDCEGPALQCLLDCTVNFPHYARGFSMIELESDKLDGGSVSAVDRRASRGDNTGLGGLGVANMI